MSFLHPSQKLSETEWGIHSHSETALLQRFSASHKVLNMEFLPPEVLCFPVFPTAFLPVPAHSEFPFG